MIYIALTVDPRLKFEALDEQLTIIYFNDQIKIEEIKIEEIKNEINSLLYNLYNYYKEKYGDDIVLLNHHVHLQALHIFINEL